MYSFAYRTYSPMSMRWMTSDPAKDGTNWYQYVSGDPVNLWDPLGLCEEELNFWQRTVKKGIDILDKTYIAESDGYKKAVEWIEKVVGLKNDQEDSYIKDPDKYYQVGLEVYKDPNLIILLLNVINMQPKCYINILVVQN